MELYMSWPLRNKEREIIKVTENHHMPRPTVTFGERELLPTSRVV